MPPSDHGSYTALMSSPHKAISVGMISKKGKSYKIYDKSSTASSVRRKAERAGLIAHAVALPQKHSLEKQEADLEAMKANIRAKMEKLELQTDIDAATAKIKTLEASDNDESDPDPRVGEEQCDNGQPAENYDFQDEDNRGKPVEKDNKKSFIRRIHTAVLFLQRFMRT